MSKFASMKHRRTREASLTILAMSTFVLLGVIPGFFLIGPTPPSEIAGLVPFQSSVNLLLPGHVRSKTRLGKGRFLVASRQLKDPNFSESVVLLIEYSRLGALGLVINRPTEVRLSTMFPDIEGLLQRTDRLFMGGPVSPNHLMLLIQSDTQLEDSHRVFDDTYVTTSQVVFQRIIGEKKRKFQVYAGHAGWAPGQLDQEVSRGDWHILRADAETIFDKTPSEVWPALIRRSLGLWVRRVLPHRLDLLSVI
jgi:putative transcriptional regulator